MSRLAFISTQTQTPWAASDELWSQAALRLAQSGHQVGVHVPYSRPLAPALAALVAAGCTLQEPPLNYRYWRLFGDRYLQRRYRWIADYRPDLAVLSLDHQSAGIEWMEACQAHGIPYVVVVQCVIETSWPGDGHNLRLQRAYEAARVPFFVSERNRQAVGQQLGTGLEKARLVREPARVPYDAAPAWPSALDGYRLACVARLRPSRKAQDVLLTVLREPKWQQRPVHVTFFGADESRTTLAALAEMYGLRNVTFAGFQPEVEGIWATHHALVLPSRYEGMPMALVDAMLCARPVITTAVGGAAELLAEGGHGFLAAAPTPRLLDDALERAWAQRAQWPALGQAAARRVREWLPRDPVGLFVQELLGLLPPGSAAAAPATPL